ncbi:MAG: HAMP domain-containing protein [Treponema sp.]|nr:HAMP domain-containing protein [Treponema sp.]
MLYSFYLKLTFIQDFFMKQTLKKLSLRKRFVGVFAGLIIVATTLLSVIAVRIIKVTVHSQASAQSSAVAENAVRKIDGDAFERFSKNIDEQDPYFESTRQELLRIKEAVDCEYLYTMYRRGSTWYYVIDGSCDPSDYENYSDPGSEEDVSSWGAAPFKAYDEGVPAVSDFENQDGWGWTISSYYPIKNSRGVVVGIVGCDIGVDTIVEDMNRHIMQLAVIDILIVLLGGILIYVFSRAMFKPMKDISDSMENIASGKADLTERIPEKGGKELVLLAHNCNSVISSLASLVSNLQEHSSVLSSTGSEMSDRTNLNIESINASFDSVSNIDQKIKVQSEKVQLIADSIIAVENEINGLKEKLNYQADAINESTSAADEISKNIKSVNEIVDNITSDYERLETEAEDGKKNQLTVTENVAQIAQQSKNLNEANAAIARIASQTNLLAMNAAIEAAHAGEAGKGFGVVADEIRSLAETSSSQSKQIKSLLDDVTKSIEQIVASSDISASSFENVTDRIVKMSVLMKQVQSAMTEENESVKNILTTVDTLNSTTESIAEASKQMQSESGKLFKEIEELKDIAEQTHAESAVVSENMNEMRASAESVSESAQKNQKATGAVIDMITGFKV